MKELYNLLETKERRILIVLSALLVCAFVFHSAFALEQKRAYRRSLKSLSTFQTDVELLKTRNRQRKKEWMKWDEARRDLIEIGEKYFYKEDRKVNELRMDLLQVRKKSGIRRTSDLKFDYAEAAHERKKTVRVSFNIAGLYYNLKRFIHRVETHPKFLILEKINFIDIDSQTGRVELSVELVGYYEN